jgi:hypothetical protein
MRDVSVTWRRFVEMVDAELKARGLTPDVLVESISWDPPPDGVYVMFVDPETREVRDAHEAPTNVITIVMD